MTLQDEKRDLLKKIGSGKMATVAYDTAWVARLNDFTPEISDKSLGWLCEHQLSDGSWGAETPYYYHDRVISTLAAMIALSQRGRRGSDMAQIRRGQEALRKIISGATHGLAADPNGATVGFEMIAPTLAKEAVELGLIDDQANHILGRMAGMREAKVEKLKGRITRSVTMAFSAEMAGRNLDMLDVEKLPEANGSIGFSPSATAYYALRVRPGDPNALAYLHEHACGESGGIPDVSPFDTFEVAWTLRNLHLTDPSIVNDPGTLPHIEFLKQAWQKGQGRGVGFAADYSVKDSDDSGLTFEVLSKFGVQLDLSPILTYENNSHFCCYDLEADPSISAQVHVLGALRSADLPVNCAQSAKVISYLQSMCQQGRWIDKWHLSPYYPTAHAVIVCAGYAGDTAAPAVDWILATQSKDGSWGTYGPTAEETAYCVQALSAWNTSEPSKVDIIIAIKKGISWLLDHVDLPYPPLWIGKALYCPEYVVRSAVLSALEAR